MIICQWDWEEILHFLCLGLLEHRGVQSSQVMLRRCLWRDFLWLLLRSPRTELFKSVQFYWKMVLKWLSCPWKIVLKWLFIGDTGERCWTFIVQISLDKALQVSQVILRRCLQMAGYSLEILGHETLYILVEVF